MKNLIIIFLIVVSLFGCKNSNSQNNDLISSIESNKTVNDIKLTEFIQKVYTVYNTKDTKELNRLFNPEIGVYFLHRLGAYDMYRHKDDFCFDNSCSDDYKFLTYEKEILDNQKFSIPAQPLTSTENIIEGEEIKKEGIYVVDNSTTDHLLSNVIKRRIKIAEEEEIPILIEDVNGFIENIIELESSSKRIVFAEEKIDYYGNSFAFYVSLIDNKWYLTIIDFISSDCSA